MESDLQLRIEKQGNVVRELKGNKDASKETLKAEIDKLLELKKLLPKMEKPSKEDKKCQPGDGAKKQKPKKDKSKNKQQSNKEKGKNKQNKKVSLTEASGSSNCISDADRMARQSAFNYAMLKNNGNEQVVTPWDVEAEGGVDYEKLIDQFGCSSIPTSLIERIEKLTNCEAHRYLRRGFFYSHRELDQILNCYEKGEKFYLYTGRGPSSGSLHMGHLIPFTFTAWLQKVFDVPLVIQLTNDEKFLFKDQSLEQSISMMMENVKDIIACGFDMKKTFIFADTEYIKELYPNILRIQKCVTYNQVRGTFGFTGSDNIGKSAFPAVQAAPSFSSTFPVPLKGIKNMRCLIPQAIDQDPYFRMTRDVAPRLGYVKPSLIHSKFFPALQGSSTKMSASSAVSTIFVSDSPEDVANKVKKYAFSGGGETKADHEAYGANLDVDIPYQYLTFMLEDDAELEEIAKEYGSGRMMTGQVKQRLIDVMVEYNTSFQARRAKITDEDVAAFMKVRPLEF